MSSRFSTKKCPFCAQEIKVEAIKCHHCGEFLESSSKQVRFNPRVLPTTKSRSNKQKNGLRKLLFVCGVFTAGFVLVRYPKVRHWLSEQGAKGWKWSKQNARGLWVSSGDAFKASKGLVSQRFSTNSELKFGEYTVVESDDLKFYIKGDFSYLTSFGETTEANYAMELKYFRESNHSPWVVCTFILDGDIVQGPDSEASRLLCN